MNSTRPVLLASVTRRLLITVSLCFVACFLFFIAFYLLNRPWPVMFVVLLVGVVGGFVGVQRRLPEMADAELELLNGSWEYVVLSPFVSGILAILLYCTFLSGLIGGTLFPTFESTAFENAVGLGRLFEVRSENHSDYAKLLVWSFVAGYSENFVVGILGALEARAAGNEGSQDQDGQ